MTKINLSYNIVNYTPASASPVDTNFDTIEAHINQELVERDGTVAMRAQLKLVGNPVADLDAAPKQYVDQVLPIGIIMMYGGAGIPPGGKWAVCNGAELQTSSYADLYGVIGHNFSPSGTPGSRFNLPNMQDRFPMGKGTQTSMGETGGKRDATLVLHDHGMKGHTHGMAHHTHGMSNHTHSIDHNHGSVTTSQVGDHQHSQDTDNAVGANAGSRARGATAQYTGNFAGAPSGSHTHTVNLPAFNGNSGAPGNNTTAGPSDNDTGAPSDNTTGQAGQDGTNDNLPPYLGVQYIIRVK